jgi:hypothetical protein
MLYLNFFSLRPNIFWEDRGMLSRNNFYVASGIEPKANAEIVTPADSLIEFAESAYCCPRAKNKRGNGDQSRFG